MNTQALFCLSLPLVIAGCAQQTSTSLARDSAFAQAGRPPAVADIYQRSPEVTRSGRYTLVSARSAAAQREPLSQLIDITMPGQLVTTVGDGFRYLLFQSGYALCGQYGAAFAELLNRPLPAVQRKIGPVRLSEALQVVAGPAWRMTVDDVSREVCFVLRETYQAQARASAPVATTPVTAVSPDTLRDPKTGALPGNQPEPVVAGQWLDARAKAGGAVPAAQSLPVPPPTPAATTASPATPRNPFTGDTLTGTPLTPAPATSAPAAAVSATPAPAAPVTASPVAAKPAVPSSPSVRLTGTPVTAVATGPEWKAEPGTTLKESLTAWAGRAACPNGGQWVVIWQTATDYRIDAPLVFKGSFESALADVFDLYRKADKPLFAEASRLQCLVSVADRPADRS